MPNSLSKNKIISSLIVGAVVFSVLAAFLIYRYMSPSRGTIYVFNDSYTAGEQLTSDMLIPVQVDASIVMAGKRSNVAATFVTPAEYQEVVKSGDSLRMDVSEGMPLTSSMLSISGGSTIEMNMKSDAVAVTIPVDEYTGITNDLKEGARVNVYASTNASVQLIQQNKRVLEVFKESGSITGVALEEDIQESMELIYATTNGSIYLGLVDATGYQSAEGSDPVYNAFSTSASSTVETNVPETEAETEAEEETEPATEGTGDAVFTP